MSAKMSAKKTTLLILVILSSLTLQAKGSYTDRYLNLRKGEDNSSLVIKRLDEKEIREEILKPGILADKGDEDDGGDLKKLFENAKEVAIVIAFEKETVSPKKLRALQNRYEELTSLNTGNINASIRSDSRKDKIKELIIILEIDEEVNLSVDILFKKAIPKEEYMKEFTNFSQFINITGSEKKRETSDCTPLQTTVSSTALRSC